MLSDLTKEAVDQAIDEFRADGRDTFLKRYGYSRSLAYFIVREDMEFDSKAIAGVAVGKLPGRLPLKPADFSGGERAVAKTLRRLGFEVVKRPPESARNPPWARDELILALDLYMTNPVAPPGKTSKAVAELSDVLNTLAVRLGRAKGETFRNANGVYMKMMNFRRFDPTVIASGAVGLTRGNKDEAIVWSLYSEDLPKLRTTAAAIRSGLSVGDQDTTDVIDDGEEAEEGRLLTRMHRSRERNRGLIEKRKKLALQTEGRLRCEACDFDFAERYGDHGSGFIEVHHTKPLHTLAAPGKTKLSDLALLCANCHRMVHARRKWLSIADLKLLLSA